MRAAIVNSSVIRCHRWQYLNAGAYLGHVERATDELERAERQLQSATTKRNNAAQRLKDQQERAAAMEESGEIVPIKPEGTC